LPSRSRDLDLAVGDLGQTPGRDDLSGPVPPISSGNLTELSSRTCRSSSTVAASGLKGAVISNDILVIALSRKACRAVWHFRSSSQQSRPLYTRSHLAPVVSSLTSGSWYAGPMDGAGAFQPYPGSASRPSELASPPPGPVSRLPHPASLARSGVGENRGVAARRPAEAVVPGHVTASEPRRGGRGWAARSRCAAGLLISAAPG